MANRPVFIVTENTDKDFVRIENVDFKWFSGFSMLQKKQSIDSLHDSFIKSNKKYKKEKLLEISTKSDNLYGVKLSAFNLTLRVGTRNVFLENIFQSSKVFEDGGPYLDLLFKEPVEAKRDERLKSSGKLINFYFENVYWELEPKSIFYDWLYINAVYSNKDLAEKIISYDFFTDIEYNPKKSFNCQAYSAALYVSLYRRGLLDEAVKSVKAYKSIIKKDKDTQLKLF